MKRRTALAALAAAIPAQAQSKAIQLHVDLDVDPAREKEMVSNYHKTFHPVITKQPGFVDVKLMKLRKVAAGTGPSNAPYRLLISFETEEHRLKWVATDEHQRVWPTIEKTLRGNKFSAVLYDVA
jgi:hypothetical protein